MTSGIGHPRDQRERGAQLLDGLHAAFVFAILACLIAAAASLMRGGHPGR